MWRADVSNQWGRVARLASFLCPQGRRDQPGVVRSPCCQLLLLTCPLQKRRASHRGCCGHFASLAQSNYCLAGLTMHLLVCSACCYLGVHQSVFVPKLTSIYCSECLPAPADNRILSLLPPVFLPRTTCYRMRRQGRRLASSPTNNTHNTHS